LTNVLTNENAVDEFDRPGVGIELLKQPCVHLRPDSTGNRPFRLLVPER
jgi:hypothetical protein